MPYWLARPVFWVLFRTLLGVLGGLRVEGRENVPRSGGVLVAPNHVSDTDPPVIAVSLPRSCWLMGKQEIFDMKVVGAICRWLHGFPVKRYSADRAALRRAETLLKAGEAVVVFPEGRLSPDGNLQPLLPGFLLIARGANVPILPTVVLGTNRLMPNGTLRLRRSGEPCTVRFGSPVRVEELTGGLKGSEALRVGAERLWELLRALQEGEPYPDYNLERLRERVAARPPAEALRDMD